MSFNSPLNAVFAGVSQVTASLGKNDPELGSRASFGGGEYIFVYNTGNSQISPGRAAVLSGVTGYSVTVSSTINADHIIGVCYHATLTTGTYGWLLTRGIGVVATSTSVALATGAVATVQADGYWDNLQISGVTSQVQPSARAKVLVTAASAATGAAYISCY